MKYLFIATPGDTQKGAPKQQMSRLLKRVRELGCASTLILTGTSDHEKQCGAALGELLSASAEPTDALTARSLDLGVITMLLRSNGERADVIVIIAHCFVAEYYPPIYGKEFLGGKALRGKERMVNGQALLISNEAPSVEWICTDH